MPYEIFNIIRRQTLSYDVTHHHMTSWPVSCIIISSSIVSAKVFSCSSSCFPMYTLSLKIWRMVLGVIVYGKWYCVSKKSCLPLKSNSHTIVILGTGIAASNYGYTIPKTCLLLCHIYQIACKNGFNVICYNSSGILNKEIKPKILSSHITESRKSLSRDSDPVSAKNGSEHKNQRPVLHSVFRKQQSHLATHYWIGVIHFQISIFLLWTLKVCIIHSDRQHGLFASREKQA